MALAAPAGAGGVVLVPYLDGERTPNRPDATGNDRRVCAPTPRRAQLARAAFEGVMCGLLDGLDALLACGVARTRRDRADRGRCRVAAPPAGGRRPRAGTGRRARRGLEHVACGAAVQAAAVLHGTDAAAVAAAWSLDRGVVTEPSLDADRAAGIRERYALAAAQGVV